MRPLALILLILATPALAAADNDDKYLKVDFGMVAGSQKIGPMDGSTMGMHLDVARVMGRTQIMLEYQLLHLADGGEYHAESAGEGIIQRVGATLRFALQRKQIGNCCFNTSFFVEAGFGRQFVFWNEGGRLTRDDLAVGLAFDATGTGRKRRGMTYAFRATLAENEAADSAPSVCGGPCDSPSKPPRFDIGLMFMITIAIGL